MHLVKVMARLLVEESNALKMQAKQSSAAPAHAMRVLPNPEAEAAETEKIKAAFTHLQWCVDSSNQAITENQHTHEQFVLQYQQLNRLKAQQHQSTSEEQAQLLAQQYQASQVDIQREAGTLGGQREKIFTIIHDTTRKLDDLHTLVVFMRLQEWKTMQKRGLHTEEQLHARLAVLQSFIQCMADVIWKMRSQVKQMMILQAQMALNGNTSFTELMPCLDKLIATLVAGTFVVDNQPPLVMKTQTRFGASVRSLLGQSFNCHMDTPEVTCSIINEAQARLVAGEQKTSMSAAVLPKHDTSGELLNSRKSMQFHPDGNVLCAQFKNIQLKKIKRGGLKGDSVVTEEKFCLVFQTTIKVGGELQFAVRTLSLPVVVVVHGNQQANAEATILWDNAFSADNALPFMVPPSVPWFSLSQVLLHFFGMMNQQSLEANQLEYLATKLLPEGCTDHSKLVSWQSFNKESLRDRSFTFWEWFYGATELTRKHLAGPWQNRLITGFVGKVQVQQALVASEPGTFLLRFSDSAVGGITVSWVGKDAQGNTQVWNLQPWYAKDFGIRSLADRIRDLVQLQYLYPAVPKDQAFSPYYSKVQQPSALPGDYVPCNIVNIVQPPTLQMSNLSMGGGSGGVPSPAMFSPGSPMAPLGMGASTMPHPNPGATPVNTLTSLGASQAGQAFSGMNAATSSAATAFSNAVSVSSV